MKKVIFYFHGSKPSEQDAKLLKDAGVTYESRNADAFRENEVEPAELVLIDGGNANAVIRQAYQSRAEVMPVKDYVAKLEEKAGTKDKDGNDLGKFDPDAPLKAVGAQHQPPKAPEDADAKAAQKAKDDAAAKAKAEDEAKAKDDAERKAS